MTRACRDCSSPISRHSKQGRCKPCATRVSRADPEKEAKRRAALRLALGSPQHRARLSAARRQMEIDRKDDPVWIAYKRDCGKRVRALYDASFEAQARNLARRADVGEQLSEQRLGWCPPDRRAEYQRSRKKVGAVAARAAIEAEIAAAERARIAAMTPFERQMEKVRNGARLIEKPVLRRADPLFTLGGVAPEAM